MTSQESPEASPTRLSMATNSARKEEMFSELNNEVNQELVQTRVTNQTHPPKLNFPSLNESTLRNDPKSFAVFRDNHLLNPISQPRESGRPETTPTQMKDLLVNKFIGEFRTDQSFKIIRGFINQSDSDRIFYTRFEPTGANRKVNIMIIHGYGHSGNFLEVP